jgi:hypothetical protein
MIIPRMKKILAAAVFTVAAVATTAGTASAGGVANTIGVGAEFQLSGAGGLSVNYDAGRFHAGGFFGLNDPDGPSNTQFEVGGRFFFHIASTASADFSIGGSVGVRNTANGPNVDSTTEVFIEPGFQIRAFIVPSVALSFTGGISVGAGDISSLTIDSQIVGLAGVHYYF